MKMEKRKRILAVFDFDHTLIDLNTDVEVQKLSPGGKLPPEVKELRDKMGWTEFMQQVFIHLDKSKVTYYYDGARQSANFETV